MRTFFEQYADEGTRARLDRIEPWLTQGEPEPEPLDEFAAIGVDDVDALRALFAPRFYFGCEADDPMVAWAFADRLNPAGARLRPMFSSDIGHWDVPQMNGVLAEAWELVDDGHLDLEAFRAFSFDNAVRFYGSLDPDCFAGTVIEQQAAAVLAQPDVERSPSV